MLDLLVGESITFITQLDIIKMYSNDGQIRTSLKGGRGYSDSSPYLKFCFVLKTTQLLSPVVKLMSKIPLFVKFLTLSNFCNSIKKLSNFMMRKEEVIENFSIELHLFAARLLSRKSSSSFHEDVAPPVAEKRKNF